MPYDFRFPLPETNWAVILPAAFVVLTGIFALVLELIFPRRNNNLIVFASLLGLGLTAAMLLVQVGGDRFSSFADTLVRDDLSIGLQLTLVLGTAMVILFAEPYLREKRIPFAEFYPLVLWSTAGAMLMASTKHLLVLFVGLEILSISLYVLAGLSRDEESSNESALKYFLLGAFASGFLLYGISMLYGASGSLNLDGIAQAWSRGDQATRTLVVFGLALVLVGLGFKASFFPFQQWTPDVYQGAPTPVSAFLATASKVATFGALFRVLDASSQLRDYWLPALSVIAAATILYGNLVALRQRDVKRILGYSSIAQAGYVLVAILAHAARPGEIGPGTLIYFLFGYTLTTIGAFAVLALAARDGREATSLEDLHGLARRSPLAGFCLVIFVASLIGLPLTSGLLGKLLIFQDAIKAGLTPLAIVLAVGSIVSFYYYVLIAYHAVVPEEGEGRGFRLADVRPAAASAYAICAVGVVGAFLFFGPILANLAPQR